MLKFVVLSSNDSSICCAYRDVGSLWKCLAGCMLNDRRRRTKKGCEEVGLEEKGEEAVEVHNRREG
jgi:hypothetical protein